MFDCLAMGEVDAGVEMTKTELNAMLSPSKVRFNATFHCGDDEPTYKPNDKGDDVVSDFIEDCNSCCDKFRDADTKIFNIVRKMCYTNQAGNLCTCDFVQSPASISVPISPFVPQVVGFSKSKGTKYWVPIKDGSTFFLFLALPSKFRRPYFYDQ